MSKSPFNPEIHAQLLSLGYTHEFDPGDRAFADIKTDWDPATDVYTKDEDYIVIDSEGKFVPLIHVED
jgi:hypothetical protein